MGLTLQTADTRDAGQVSLPGIEPSHLNSCAGSCTLRMAPSPWFLEATALASGQRQNPFFGTLSSRMGEFLKVFQKKEKRIPQQADAHQIG